MTGLLSELQSAVRGVAERVGPSVAGLGRGWGRGSGVIVAPGRLLTNAHVLRGDEVAVSFGGGDAVHGRVTGVDADLDLAVIAADTGDRPAVAWAPEAAAAADVGTPVFAVADPGGRGLRVTFGLVSAAGRAFRGPRGRRIGGAIEHSAPLPRGSSGSALVDADGRLLGINTVRLEGGLILAVPADAALRARVEALGRGEAPARPRLGIALAPPAAARRLRTAVGLPERDGLLVRAVQPGSPAAAAGIQRGDLLVSAGGSPLASVDDLFDALETASGTLDLGVVRGTEELAVAAPLSP
ncbi:MAG TPA: S1C family serine protease [Solirubrobacteraceae bacterium]|nr:S1C family serine protease [Solirubrobacteraceae bacterium]